MKKGVWKRALGLGLCAVMLLSLGACGRDGGDGGPGKSGDSSLAKQNVYSYQDIETGELGDSADVMDMTYINDRVYVMLNIYDWSSETPGNKNKLLTFLPDGSDVKTIELENPELNQDSNMWVSSVAFGADGTLYAQRQINSADLTDPDNPVYETISELVCWDPEGGQRWAKSIDELHTPEENFYITNLLPAQDGSVSLMSNGDKAQLFTFDRDGNQQDLKQLNAGNMQNVGNTFLKSDGTILIMSYDDSYTKQFISVYDPATDSMGEKTELPETLINYSMRKGTTTDFILTNNLGVYTYNIGDPEPKQIMNFINSDLLSNTMSGVTVIDDDRFVGAYYGIEDGKTRIAVFTRVDPKDIPDKSVITLGFASYLDSSVRQRIVDFNKTNSLYRIVIRDYSVYNTMEDYQASFTKLNNDIISGDMPDILISDPMMQTENFIAKGLLADIGSLIQKDEELSKVEFLENVFQAYSVDEKLYFVVPSFSVGTVIGKTSLVGDGNGWTMADLQALMDRMPEGTQSFGEMTRSWFFSMLMQYCGSDFVDASTGKCKFDSPEFLNVLEFAKTLPEEISREDYEEDYWMNYDTQYREERTVLMPTSIYSVGNMNYTINGYFGEDVNFIGFPKESGNGSVISANQSFVLAAKSKSLEGAWEFVRYYLTEEYQKELSWGMPVRKDFFMEKAQEATQKPYYMEDGKKVEYEESFMMSDGTEIKLPPMSQEQVDKIVNFILTVDKAQYYNQPIQNIIEEEAAAFLAGQKGAQEVAQIIQSRAQLYVSENR